MEDRPHVATRHFLEINGQIVNFTALDAASSQLLFAIGDLQGRLAEGIQLSRQKLPLLTKSEQSIVERTIESTKTAISHLEDLCQRAPDASQASGKSRESSLKHSPQFEVYLARLHIVSQHLNTISILLCNRQEEQQDARPRTPAELSAAPLIQDNKLFAAMRNRNMSRRNGRFPCQSAVELPGPEPVELPADVPPHSQARPSSMPEAQELEAESVSSALKLLKDAAPSGKAAFDSRIEAHERQLQDLTRDLDGWKLDNIAPRPTRISSDNPPGQRLIGKARSRKWLETQASKPTG